MSWRAQRAARARARARPPHRRDREAVERLAADLGERLVQVPLRGLRRAAWNHSSAVISNFILGLEDESDPGDGSAGPR